MAGASIDLLRILIGIPKDANADGLYFGSRDRAFIFSVIFLASG